MASLSNDLLFSSPIKKISIKIKIIKDNLTSEKLFSKFD